MYHVVASLWYSPGADVSTDLDSSPDHATGCVCVLVFSISIRGAGLQILFSETFVHEFGGML